MIRDFVKTLHIKYYRVWDKDLITDSIHFLQYHDTNVADVNLTKILQLLSYIKPVEFKEEYVKDLVRQVFDTVFVDKSTFNFLEIYEEEDVRIDLTLPTDANWAEYYLVVKLEETGEYLSDKDTLAYDEGINPQGVWVRDIGSKLTDKKLWKVIIQLENGTVNANGDGVNVIEEAFIGLKQKPVGGEVV